MFQIASNFVARNQVENMLKAVHAVQGGKFKQMPDGKFLRLVGHMTQGTNKAK